jgi:hypothetical protein
VEEILELMWGNEMEFFETLFCHLVWRAKQTYKSPPPHSRTMHLDIIKVFYLPTDAQEKPHHRINHTVVL